MGALDHLAGFAKTSVLKLRGVEHALLPGSHRAFLRGGEQEHAEKLIEEENAESIGLRHPWLTGIPTLGVWPAISEGTANTRIREEMFRKYPGLLESWNETSDKIRQEEIENQRLQTERDKANQARNAVLAAGLAGTSIMSEYNRGRNMNKESQIKIGSLDHLAGFAKEAEAEGKLILDSAIEGLKKEAEARGIEITDEQALEILKEAGFWSGAMKPRKFWGQDKLLSKFSPATQEKLLKVKHLPPPVPYEGSIVGNLLIGSEKAIVGAGKAVKGVGKGVKAVTGLPKNLAHGIVETPRVVKETVQRAVKGPEKSEAVKKILAALGIGTAVGGGVVGANVVRKKLWGDKSITPFGSSGEWGGVLGSRIEKKEDEEQEKAAMVNPLMGVIPAVTGIKSKDKDWDLKKSLILGAAAGILLKIPKFKAIGGSGLEKTIAGGITGGALGGIGQGIGSLLRKKEPEVVE